MMGSRQIQFEVEYSLHCYFPCCSKPRVLNYFSENLHACNKNDTGKVRERLRNNLKASFISQGGDVQLV